MTQSDIKNFDNLSEKYSTWILKYCSNTLSEPLFLVWYTDPDRNSNDRLLTYRTGDIFAVPTLADLRDALVREQDNLVTPDHLKAWLKDSNGLTALEHCTYDLDGAINSLNQGVLDVPTLESFANFINLFQDFIHQDTKNDPLQAHLDNELIKETWTYFYEFIFWPRFNDKEKFEAWDRPPLNIDTTKLSSKLNEMIRAFEYRIRTIE